MACEDIVPTGQIQHVGNEVELAAAMNDPLVSCILLTEEVTPLTAEFVGPQVTSSTREVSRQYSVRHGRPCGRSGNVVVHADAALLTAFL